MEGQKSKQGLGRTFSSGLKGWKGLSNRKKSEETTDRGSIGPQKPKRPSLDKKALEAAQKEALEKRESLKDEGIENLPKGFFEEDFDPGLYELQQLQPGFQVSELDEVAEGRANVLEFVSERLSKHVLANYDMFLKGINEAASVETDLQAAVSLVRSTRSVLALSQTEVGLHLDIANRQKQRLALAQMSQTLLRLQQAFSFQKELQSAQEDADYTTCFWLCAQCCESLENLDDLKAAEELLKSVNKLYEDSLRRMQSALNTICSDFDDSQYCKIVEAYTFLGNTPVLGEDVSSAFVNVINTSTMKVVRGVVLTRSGLEERVRNTNILQEILKWLPPDLYRQCLSKVLMVIFDILASYYRMNSWHETAIQTHLSKISQLKEQIDFLELQIAPQISQTSLHIKNPSQESEVTQKGEDNKEVPKDLCREQMNGDREDQILNNLNSKESKTQEGKTSQIIQNPGNNDKTHSKTMSASGNSENFSHENYREIEQEDSEAPSPTVNGESQANSASSEENKIHHDSSTANNLGSAHPFHTRHKSLTQRDNAMQGKANIGSHSENNLKARLLSPTEKAEQDPLREPEALVQVRQEHESEAVWGETLLKVSEALSNGRKWVWDEAGRKVSLLLSSPAAFQGEHFLQVLEWTQTIVHVGESFSGSESSHLRDAMQRHSGKFFQAYHAANLQALQQMLDQEAWTALPTPPSRVPNFSKSLKGGFQNENKSAPSSFADWHASGNPWKKQDSDSARASAEDVNLETRPSQSEIENKEHEEEIESPQEVNHPLSPQPKQANGNIESRDERQGNGNALLLTNSSWKMMQWLSEYAGLMRLLPTDASRIYCGCCELFELYLLHIFYCYSEVPLIELFRRDQNQQAALDAIPVRLKTAAVRILTRSLPRLRTHYLPQTNSQTSASTQGASQGIIQPVNGMQRPQRGNLENAASSKSLSHPGNMYGLKERKVAVDSLELAANQLQSALPTLSKFVGTSIHVPDFHSLDTFTQTLKASRDLKDVILRAGARLNLPLSWLPERLSEQNFNLEEPPTKASPWVGVLLNHVKMFWQRLVTIGGMSTSDCEQMWQYGLQYIAEMVLEGFARGGVKGKCSGMGRSAMSVDLQGLQRGLQSISNLKNASESISSSMRVVDTYIKAFYLPWGDEVHRWAMTHPEYTQAQIMMLVTCLAESQGIKRRDRAQLISQIESDLRELR